VHGLKNCRRLYKEKVDLHVGNGVRVDALAKGTYYLTF
jgi:hypothetical protein